MKAFKTFLATISIVFLFSGILFFTSKYIYQEAWAASVSWVGTGDGVSWSDAGNWSTGIVPTALDDVLIDASVTVNLESGTTVNSLVLGNSGGTTSPVLNFTYDSVGVSTPLVIDGGDLTVNTGGNITHSSAIGSTIVGTVNIDITTGNAYVYGTINVTGRGYPKGNGPGAGDTKHKGASHAGYGGQSGSTNIYGTITEASSLGSGGGGSAGGNGGGVVKIAVFGNVTVDGEILAKAGTAGCGDFASLYSGGGGSGGSISIIATNINGSGSISADGGSAGTGCGYSSGGGGSGGRIALLYSTENSLTTTQITAMGGRGSNASFQKGGAGTIYIKSDAQTYGELRVDNVETAWTTDRSKYALTPFNSSITMDTITTANYAVVENNTTLTANDFNIVNSSYFYNNATVDSTNLNIQSSGFYFSQNLSNTIYSVLDWVGGNIVDNGGTLAVLAEGNDLTIPSGSMLELNVPKSYANVIIDGVLSHSENSTEETYKLNLTATGNLTVNSGGAVNVSRKGYTTNNGPGGTETVAGGASHAGYGGRSGSSTVYGTITDPVFIGSGGGGEAGGYGGGAIKLTVLGDITIDGEVLAEASNAGCGNMNDWYSGGGGSGGSISISATNVTGTGNISANGGTGADCHDTDGGGGSGGRIALLYSTGNSLATSQVTAMGGRGGTTAEQKGGAGTIYSKSDSQTYGDLRIDNVETTWSTNKNRYALTSLISTVTMDSITIDNFAHVENNTTITATNLDITNSAYFYNNSIVDTGNLNIKSSGFFFSQELSDTTYSTLDWVGGNIVDNGGTLPLLIDGVDLTIPSGSMLEMNVPKSFSNVIVDGVLSHSENSAETTNKLDLTTTGNLTVNSGGVVNVSGKGYLNSSGPGAGADGGSKNGGGGGAHGGDGGNGESGIAGGTAYDEPLNPQDFGSGGGNGYGSTNPGGFGGGLAIFDIGGNLSLEGSILANGADGSAYSYYYSSGGGAGGGVNITTASFTGGGVIEATGGTTGHATHIFGDAYGGGGGGGLVYVLYNESTFTGSVDVSGGIGANNGGAGVSTLQVNNQAPVALHPNISTPQNLYAGHSYSIDVIYSDPDGQDDISELYFKIVNSLGDDIEFKATGSTTDLTDQLPEVLAGSMFIDNVSYSIYPSYGTSEEIKVTWVFDIGWNWVASNDIEYGVKALDSMGESSEYSVTTNDYLYKNTLEFNTAGALTVTNVLGDPIVNESWMPPNASVSWTGYEVVYVGETDVYPNSGDYNVKLEDSTGRFWLESGDSGSTFNITSNTVNETLATNSYLLSIVDIPSGGSSTDTKTFTIKVDADYPEILSLESSTHLEEETWYSENSFTALWDIIDSHSGVDTVYSYNSRSSNLDVSDVEDSGVLTTSTQWVSDVLVDGVHYFYLLVKDLVGNSILDVLTFRIDSSLPNIVDIVGSNEDVWQNTESEPLITWTDPVSVSDDVFYITTDGTTPSISNFKYATNQTSYRLPSLGEGQTVLKVRPQNGAGTYGEVRSFIFKYDSEPTSQVRNITTSLSSTNRVTLNWNNPADADFNRVIVVRKASTLPTTVTDGTKVYEGTQETYTDSGLNSSTKYYYGIWAYDHVDNRSERASINITTKDINSPDPVSDFAIDTTSEIRLTWINPTNSDFSKVMLYRDETLIYEGELEQYVDTIDTEGKYEYLIYAYDDSGNRSTERTLTLDLDLEEEEEQQIVIIGEDKNAKDVEEGKKTKVSSGESVEIQIPVEKLFGDVEPEDSDVVVLRVGETEYEMFLSEDRKTYTGTITAPQSEGEHTIYAVATRRGEVLSQFTIGFEVVNRDNEVGNEKIPNIWIIGGAFVGILLFIILTIGLVISKSPKKS